MSEFSEVCCMHHRQSILRAAMLDGAENGDHDLLMPGYDLDSIAEKEKVLGGAPRLQLYQRYQICGLNGTEAGRTDHEAERVVVFQYERVRHRYGNTGGDVREEGMEKSLRV